MIKKVVLLLTVVYAFFNSTGYSQADLHLLNISPASHSPEVSSFAKYIDFSISLFTGQANVNKPLCELTSGYITVPISLRYHKVGIKVEEVAKGNTKILNKE